MQHAACSNYALFLIMRKNLIVILLLEISHIFLYWKKTIQTQTLIHRSLSIHIILRFYSLKVFHLVRNWKQLQSKMQLGQVESNIAWCLLLCLFRFRFIMKCKLKIQMVKYLSLFVLLKNLTNDSNTKVYHRLSVFIWVFSFLFIWANSGLITNTLQLLKCLLSSQIFISIASLHRFLLDLFCSANR